MMNRRHALLPVAHRFLHGGRDDAPLLIPLAMPGRESRLLVKFCRSVCSQASILLPVLDPVRTRNEGAAADPHAPSALRLGSLLRKAASFYELELVPAVLVGHGAGADLAVRLLAQCSPHLAACILLRPTQPTAPLPHGTLAGLSILLACDSHETGPGSVEQQLRRTLAAAGADVVCQRVARRTGPGGLDTAICHVFLQALFPAIED